MADQFAAVFYSYFAVETALLILGIIDSLS